MRDSGFGLSKSGFFAIFKGFFVDKTRVLEYTALTKFRSSRTSRMPSSVSKEARVQTTQDCVSSPTAFILVKRALSHCFLALFSANQFGRCRMFRLAVNACATVFHLFSRRYSSRWSFG
jgi:hypothetical protein